MERLGFRNRTDRMTLHDAEQLKDHFFASVAALSADLASMPKSVRPVEIEASLTLPGFVMSIEPPEDMHLRDRVGRDGAAQDTAQTLLATSVSARFQEDGSAVLDFVHEGYPEASSQFAMLDTQFALCTVRLIRPFSVV